MAKQIYVNNIPVIFNKRSAKLRKLAELRALFIASGKIEGLTQDENDYIFAQLFDIGKIAAARMRGKTGIEPLCFVDFIPQSWNYLDRPLSIRLQPRRPLSNIDSTSAYKVGADAIIMYITGTEQSIASLLEEAVDQYIEAQATMINNLNLNKMPFIGRIKNDTQGRIVKAMISGMIDNKPYIMIPDDAGDIDVLPKNTAVPFLASQLKALENQFNSDLLTILGIDNGFIAKKERVLVDEINANNAIINSFRQMYRDRITAWIDDINLRFGTDYKFVDYAEVSEAVVEAIQPEQPEVNENE